VAAALFPIYQFTQTLYQLHIAEGERDRWQRPDDVIDSLKLKGGDTVTDVGCGVGYSSLKLAPKVAEHGSVLAEDILDESLTILWIKAFLHHQSNIRVIHGDLDDPHLPKGGVDAVLIANSYHEFTKPLAYWTIHFTHFAQRDDSLRSIADLGRTKESPVKSRCSDTKSTLQ
jgi:cyclopropane fatty-acyl-phospholipid synthase-like methyltransferase